MAQDGALQIKELLEKKRDVLCEIAEVTGQQNSLLQQDNVDLLLANIEQRQELIDAVDELDAQMLALTEGMTGGGDAERKAFIKRLHPALWDDVMAVLKNIVEQDKKNEQRALAVMEDYRSRIRQMGETRTAVEGYLPTSGAEGAYFDKKN